MIALAWISPQVLGQAKEGRGFSPAGARLMYIRCLAAVAACGRKLQRRREQRKLASAA
jgi:hypothetical protein